MTMCANLRRTHRARALDGTVAWPVSGVAETDRDAQRCRTCTRRRSLVMFDRIAAVVCTVEFGDSAYRCVSSQDRSTVRSRVPRAVLKRRAQCPQVCSSTRRSCCRPASWNDWASTSIVARVRASWTDSCSPGGTGWLARCRFGSRPTSSPCSGSLSTSSPLWSSSTTARMRGPR